MTELNDHLKLLSRGRRNFIAVVREARAARHRGSIYEQLPQSGKNY